MEKSVFHVRIVGIIFDPKKRMLLVEKGLSADKYSFLEGDLEYDEEMDQTLKRFIKEKTGYKVHNLGAVYAENVLKNPDKLKIHFLCEATEGKEKPGKEVEELIWVKPSEIEKTLEVKLPARLREYITNLE